MDGNNLRLLTSNSFHSTKLRSLTEISMTNCKLNVLSDQSFSSLGKLRSINLSNNNITSFSPKVINDTVGQKQITVGTIHKLRNRDKGRGKVVKMVVPPSLPPSTRFSSFDFTTFKLLSLLLKDIIGCSNN